MEHFAIASDFIGLFNTKLREKGYVYLEVPNCRFLEGFEKRIYESPHLTFWNSELLRKLSHLFKFKLILIYTSGVTLLKTLRTVKFREINFLIGRLQENIKMTLKIISLKILRFSNSETFHYNLCSFEENNPNYWTIRTLYQKK